MVFFARDLPQWPELADTVAPTLIPPVLENLQFTLGQQFYAGSHLWAFSLISSSAGCRVTLSWDVGAGQSGTEKQP